MKRKRQGYEDIAVAVPVTIPYTRFSIRTTHWWLGQALSELLKRSGLRKEQIDGICVSSFQLFPDTAVGLTQSLGVSVPSRVPIQNMSLSSSYGMRVHPITGKVARHNGIDIPAPHGTPIYATADGIVGRAQRLGGYGNYVEVEHGNAIQTRYGHMSSYVVVPGQSVKKGDILGYVGSTGRSTGNHLHYEVRIEGAPVNPMPFVRSDQMAIAAISGKNVAMGGPE